MVLRSRTSMTSSLGRSSARRPLGAIFRSGSNWRVGTSRQRPGLGSWPSRCSRQRPSESSERSTLVRSSWAFRQPSPTRSCRPGYDRARTAASTPSRSPRRSGSKRSTRSKSFSTTAASRRRIFSAWDLRPSALPTDPTADFGIEAVEERRFRVRFPAITASDLAADQATVLRIRFRCRVLRYGTAFPGWAGNTGTGTIGQKILAGNAAHLGPEDATFPPVGTADARVLSVDVPLAGGDILINTRAVPRPFSPNGDGGQRPDPHLLRPVAGNRSGAR